jgi:hypothetical protein
VGEWTAKKAAIVGLVFSGTSVVLFYATAAAMHWQQARQGQVDWGIVFASAFVVLFMCSSAAAVLSFVFSVSLFAYKRLFAFRQVSSSLAAIPEPYRLKVRHPAMIMFAGFAVLVASTQFGAAALYFVGLPTMLVACGLAAGARSPTKIPLKDAISYVGISVALVIGMAVYIVYKQ